ncbi:hypothetical protein [Tuwongella immobilis]|uniref:Phage gp6-like head-tail connector protein n=1 Tax=Tuwongella immobilis TaxID=692036 RepID=A0A6C2YGZ6_9BACT|nr:hypothetical protein [Tuwongella immobilis]VIP00687.1 Uncharacterized protein OS=Singulisphaera acidiphila (strain ATCC BAA-1392 / DSM 18658 / VKM B-2454 / MOB10) GN=Sinac_4177 PE=4 SV=1 [Tuwongella immobilis]VTR96792.1 Uncharacterized protein OS=Singulisphaera acidiphila (strain ATCC BAA-1392 / DSM 18658 / VKM B-2454 / MOB10) GN=Sinac_4177 PE=4 SV=1 [Tuwongella immobilis]
MTDLIDLDRAKTNLANFTLSPTDEATLTTLIHSCSAAIQAYCGQAFASSTFDEVLDGTDTDVLLLRHYPILAVQRVMTNPRIVVSIRNTSGGSSGGSSGGTRASVAIRSTGLRLTRISGGVTTLDDTITWSAHPTLESLVTAISAIGSGWQASVVPGYESWASADLFAPSGAYACSDRPAGLRLHTEPVDDWELHANNGWLYRLGSDGIGWPNGRGRYRVTYEAGFATVPADVQEACAQWAVSLFYQTQTNPSSSPVTPPSSVRRLLLPHRRYRL